LNQEQVHAVDIVSANAMTLKNEIENILDTKKLMYGAMLFSFENIELNKFIQRIIRRLRPVTDDKKIRLVNLCKKRIVLRTDVDRLEQVLTNLIMNAVDFVPKNKGIIKIGTTENKLKKGSAFYFTHPMNAGTRRFSLLKKKRPVWNNGLGGPSKW